MTELLHPEVPVTTIFLIRHGHTRPTEEGLLYADPGTCLTDNGLAQARALARWLAVKRLDALLSSPAVRAVTTAEVISAALELKCSTVEGLMELHVGEWEGRSYLEIKKSDPDLYARWSQDPIANSPPGGESIVYLCKRVEQQLKDLIQRYQGKRLALVTHAGVIRAGLVYALGMPVSNFWRLSIPTGSVSQVDFSHEFATMRLMSYCPS